MMRIYYFFILCISDILVHSVYAVDRLEVGVTLRDDRTILERVGTNGSWGLIEVLSFVEGFLLKVLLPLVIVGAGLYLAYGLLTAEGNEEKNKKAWK
jgi:hypothetical protein